VNGEKIGYVAPEIAPHYFDPLLAFLRHGFEEQFVRTEFERMLLVSTSPATLLDAFASFEPTTVVKWIDRAST